jgi:hypothetical protein
MMVPNQNCSKSIHISSTWKTKAKASIRNFQTNSFISCFTKSYILNNEALIGSFRIGNKNNQTNKILDVFLHKIKSNTLKLKMGHNNIAKSIKVNSDHGAKSVC